MLRALLVFISVIPCFAQLSSAWTAQFGRGFGTDTCLDPKNVGVSPSGNFFLNFEHHGETCHDRNLNGTTRNTYTSGFTGADVFTNTFNFLYGTVEYRAKFAEGLWTWDAIWMYDAASCQATYPFTTDNIGTCTGSPVPEIDIGEVHNNGVLPWNSSINQQIHHSGTGGNANCNVDQFNGHHLSEPAEDPTLNFHVYQLVWTPGSAIFKIDGFTTCTITNVNVPSTAMFLLIDSIIGPGTPDTFTSYPGTMLVDYIKVTCSASTTVPTCNPGDVIFDDEFNGAPQTTSGGQVNATGKITIQ